MSNPPRPETKDDAGYLCELADLIDGQDEFGVAELDSGDAEELRRIAKALTSPASPSPWRSIETAPKDGTRFVALRGDQAEIQHWNDDRYAKRPRPFWDSYSIMLSKLQLRHSPPTHWMPLPPPPVSSVPSEGEQ